MPLPLWKVECSTLPLPCSLLLLACALQALVQCICTVHLYLVHLFWRTCPKMFQVRCAARVRGMAAEALCTGTGLRVCCLKHASKGRFFDEACAVRPGPFKVIRCASRHGCCCTEPCLNLEIFIRYRSCRVWLVDSLLAVRRSSNFTCCIRMFVPMGLVALAPQNLGFVRRSAALAWQTLQ